jgi:hypothetical protein
MLLNMLRRIGVGMLLDYSIVGNRFNVPDQLTQVLTDRLHQGANISRVSNPASNRHIKAANILRGIVHSGTPLTQGSNSRTTLRKGTS